MEQIDVAVIGAGVTGLASALAVAERGRSVCVVERHPRAGLDTSTHNSGVIHAGIYYPTGTLKARLCVEGRHLLYDFCMKHNVPHAHCVRLSADNTTAFIASLGADEVRSYRFDDVSLMGHRALLGIAPGSLPGPWRGTALRSRRPAAGRRAGTSRPRSRPCPG